MIFTAFPSAWINVCKDVIVVQITFHGVNPKECSDGSSVNLGSPIAGWFIMDPTKIDDLGVPPFQETSK